MTEFLEVIIHDFSHIAALALETVGLLVILFGSLVGLINFVKTKFNFAEQKTAIMLSHAFSLGLNFFLGGEIIKTLTITNMNELLTLAIIMVLRVGITFVLHWEIEQAEKHN